MSHVSPASARVRPLAAGSTPQAPSAAQPGPAARDQQVPRTPAQRAPQAYAPQAAPRPNAPQAAPRPATPHQPHEPRPPHAHPQGAPGPHPASASQSATRQPSNPQSYAPGQGAPGHATPPAAAAQPPGHAAPASVPGQGGGRTVPPAEYAPGTVPAPRQPASAVPPPHATAGGADHPGAPAHTDPAHADPEYTPTERDLPVIARGVGPGSTIADLSTAGFADAIEPVPAAAPAHADREGLGPLFVVGDVHGYLDELRSALAEQGLIDAEGNWSAGKARLWFLGDFTDRGPDGIGVIDLVMQLSAQAAAAGGYCKALMGNHELLLIGAKRFGDTPVQSGAGTASFQAAWLLNGGQRTDMERLEDHHVQWMSRLDAMVEEDGHLLLHSDTTAYLEYGDSIEAVNDTVTETLQRGDADECWDLFRKFTKRFAFRDEAGAAAVRELLDTYGGERLVHGHSPIPYLLGEVGAEDADGEDSRPLVSGPHVYADDLAIAMDGGVTMAGKLLVVQFPLRG
ncbi:metallophosphoesterase [Streptomyces buecherae]|uniref:metallophosphoesterase n=1 Tax=Streptomyces buecherae TaxID=2763006 RepID=UPI003699E83B